MKRLWNYYKIKWTAFFVTVFVLGAGLSALYLARPKTGGEVQPESGGYDAPAENPAGYYSNEAFGALIETNLSELGFSESITFAGKGEGRFTITGVLTAPERLTAICSELEPYSALLDVLKDEPVAINGHIGENAEGDGCFIADTITFSAYTFPAAIATTYIEEYTGLNDLLKVPMDQITLSEDGITFREEVPLAIQTALYNQQASSPSA